MKQMQEVMAVTYKDGKVYFLDQTRLPEETVVQEMKTVEECREAIQTLKVRGAPAIGIGAAFSMVVASRAIAADTFADFYPAFKKAKEYLATSRPTAVNLFWALERMDKTAAALSDRPLDEVRQAIVDEAVKIQNEDIEVCRKIGEYGQEIISPGMGILTHWNV